MQNVICTEIHRWRLTVIANFERLYEPIECIWNSDWTDGWAGNGHEADRCLLGHSNIYNRTATSCISNGISFPERFDGESQQYLVYITTMSSVGVGVGSHESHSSSGNSFDMGAAGAAPAPLATSRYDWFHKVYSGIGMQVAAPKVLASPWDVGMLGK
jgi:hypothetical protein